MGKNAEAFRKQNVGERASDVPGGEPSLQEPPVEVAAPSAGAGAGAALQTMFEYDPQQDALRWSDEQAAAKILGVSKLAASLDEFEKRIDGVQSDVRKAAAAGETLNYCCEYRIRRENGAPHWVEERGGWVGAGPSRRLISVIRSIEHEKQREAELAWLAANDELTGLLNRAHLRVRLDETITTAQKEQHDAVYILAGIDDLGAVNADFGFEAADKVILEVSRRLAGQLGPDDYIGRVAGTKFGIVLSNCDAEGMRQISVRLMNAVRESVVETRTSGIAASICIGAVLIPAFADQANAAMARAEAALDTAKRLGKSSWSSYSEKTDPVTMRRRNTHMSDVILTALNDRRIRLAFQPIVSDLGETPRKF
ncbi:MAG: sensor domain-containing diguanylate cyclase, partial [Hyphococcus sp.]